MNTRNITQATEPTNLNAIIFDTEHMVEDEAGQYPDTVRITGITRRDDGVNVCSVISAHHGSYLLELTDEEINDQRIINCAPECSECKKVKA